MVSKLDTAGTKATKTAAAAGRQAKHKADLAKQASSQQLQGFMDFVRTQGVVGLAVGLVLGTQIKVLVDQLLASFVNPFIGLVLPGAGDLSQKKFSLSVSGETAVFAWGQFAYILMSFLIVAAIIYYLVKGLKLDKLDKAKD